MDKLTRTATKIEQEMLQSIDEAFRNVIKPVLHKHKATLDQLDKLMQPRVDKGHGDHAYPRHVNLRGEKK